MPDNDTPVEGKLIKFALAAPNSIDESRRLAFGWASVVAEKDGTLIEDAHGHLIEPIELESAVYEFVRCGGMASVMHQYMYRGAVVESMVFTPEKLAALGLPVDALPSGWWIGIYIYDKEIFELVKNGTLKMFSIAGMAIEEGVEDSEPTGSMDD